MSKMKWHKRLVPETSLRAFWKEQGREEYVGDPMYGWDLIGPDGEVLVTVDWDYNHGWDAYSHIWHGFLPGKLSGPDMAYEDEAHAKRAAELHVIEHYEGRE